MVAEASAIPAGQLLLDKPYNGAGIGYNVSKSNDLHIFRPAHFWAGAPGFVLESAPHFTDPKCTGGHMELVWETPDFVEETLNCEVAAYAGGEYDEDRKS